MTPCALPEVSELLERFQEKKATVKTRLNDIIDDLFGDFLTDVARMSRSGKCSKCNCQSVKETVSPVAGDTSSSHVEEEGEEDVSPQNLKVVLSTSKQPSPSSNNAVLETTLRSAQARARELIKDELMYDSDPVSRLSQSSGSSLKPSSSTRSLPDHSADDEMDITVTPIIENVSSSAAALAAMVSSSREMSSILNGGSGSSSGCSSNGSDSLHHLSTTTSTIEKSAPNAHTTITTTASHNNGHSKEEFDSDEEFEAVEQTASSDKQTAVVAGAANGVISNSNNNRSRNSNNPPPNYDESQEEKSEEEEAEEPETKSPENSMNDASESSIFSSEKSLDELNSLCAGLPYAKEGGRYICKFQDCCQELKSRHNLLLHQRAHLGIRPYRCKWPGCSYNSNQSSAVIRHIRTKHFLLPLTMREQQMKKIEDDRDPKEFLEVVTPSEGVISTTTASSSSAATPDSQCPSSVEALPSSDSLQSGADNDTPTTTNNNGNYPKMLRSCRQASAPTPPTNGNRGRRTSVLQNSSHQQQQQQQPSPVQQQQQSLLMPQQQANGRSSGHKLPPLPPPPPSRPSHHDESDEDEYDSEENDFEMIPMHQRLAFEMMQQQMQVAVQQQQQQQQQHQLQQQQLQQNQHSAALLHSKSPFDYARKRRLESKIFANAALSNRNRLSGLNSNNGGGVDYYGGGSGGNKVGKRAKYMGGYGQQGPTTMEPLAAHTSSSSSVSSQRGGGSNQHQYSFCPEEGCPSIFRTTLELDRHLTDVHCRLPQPQKSHLPPSGPPKEPHTYTNL